MNKKIKAIADHFGFEKQIEKLKEELDEAKVAAKDFQVTLKIEDDPMEIAYYRECLIEEMADSFIMITQLAYLLNAEDELKKKIDEKLERTLQRIETGYYA